MISYCDFCLKKHDDYYWKVRIENGRTRNYCSNILDNNSSSSPAITVGLSKSGKRLNHWKEIKARITTHEGEFLTGKEGQAYQKKYGQKYVGIRPETNWDQPQYQRELEKR